jgi:hypothetical protein
VKSFENRKMFLKSVWLNIITFPTGFKGMDFGLACLFRAKCVIGRKLDHCPVMLIIYMAQFIFRAKKMQKRSRKFLKVSLENIQWNMFPMKILKNPLCDFQEIPNYALTIQNFF